MATFAASLAALSPLVVTVPDVSECEFDEPLLCDCDASLSLELFDFESPLSDFPELPLSEFPELPESEPPELLSALSQPARPWLAQPTVAAAKAGTSSAVAARWTNYQRGSEAWRFDIFYSSAQGSGGSVCFGRGGGSGM
ncbi:MAG: hypothetical protein U1F43_10765 [Myxococcota bacterium]